MADPWLVGICAGDTFAVASPRADAHGGAAGPRHDIVFLAFKAACWRWPVPHRHHPGRSGALEAGGTADGMDRLSSKCGHRPIGQDRQLGAPASSSCPRPSNRPRHSWGLHTASRQIRNFLAAHDFAFPSSNGGLDRISVLWSDLRYCGPASTPNLVSCVVWAGGVFDRSGRALTQEVKVGRLVQARRPPG
jgi:hypothetical protein